MTRAEQKSQTTTVTVAERPTISQVLGEFLADLSTELAPKAFARYASVVQLLKHSLDRYAYQYLDKKDEELFNRLYDAKGDEHREFCDIFGPEHILTNIDEFLSYFVPHKVIAGKETSRMAGTMTKKLAKWLASKGYAELENAQDAVESGASAARDLPAAAELASLLSQFADDQVLDPEEGDLEDHFTIARVEGGRIWLDAVMQGPEPGAIGPLAIPREIARRCKEGWSIAGVVGRRGGRWCLVEVWNIYPG